MPAMRYELILDPTSLNTGDVLYYNKHYRYTFLAYYDNKLWMVRHGSDKAESSTIIRDSWYRGFEVVETVLYLNVYGTAGGAYPYPTREEADKHASGTRSGVVKLTYHDLKLVKAEVLPT